MNRARRFALGWPIGQPRDALLFKARQIVVHRLWIALEVLRELGDCPARSVQPKQGRPEAHFRMHVDIELQRTELLVSSFADLDSSRRAAHARILLLIHELLKDVAPHVTTLQESTAKSPLPVQRPFFDTRSARLI
nr:hypothetical protein [Deinococcus arcticus]